ncbi:MAG TPA: thiamine phosphate synthase, partial [Thermoanaerobaculia bacterium]|nr:thiamine phosphate synthase [Thermoanaerobaculia bacterium]
GLDAGATTGSVRPLVAIGGIDARNLAAVLAAGADTAAVLGAVCRGDVGAGCRRLLSAAGAAVA